MNATKKNAKALKASTDLDSYRAAGGEWESGANQQICKQLVGREVAHCVSSLVYHFATNPEALTGSDYSEDEIIELCRNVDDADLMTMAECRDYLQEHGGDEPRSAPNPWSMDADELGELLTEAGITPKPGIETARRQAIEAIDEELISGLDDWREAARECAQENPNEVYEHWIVSDWLAGKLKERGETTGELFGLTIWGRTTTGQAIALDAVIAGIAAEMQILEGQKHDWSESDKS